MISKLKRPILSPILVYFLYLVGSLLLKNQHTVIEGSVYRSAQPDGPALKRLIQEKKIRSIINLRGQWQSNAWYQTEATLSKEHNVSLYNLNLDAHQLPALKEMKCLTQILQTAPKPLLIHCRRGADRTGFASSIALILNQETDSHYITAQSSWRYLSFAPDSIGKLVMARYEDWLNEKKLSMNRASFLFWLDHLKRGKNYPYLDKETPQNTQDEQQLDAQFCKAIIDSASPSHSS